MIRSQSSEALGEPRRMKRAGSQSNLRVQLGRLQRSGSLSEVAHTGEGRRSIDLGRRSSIQQSSSSSRILRQVGTEVDIELASFRSEADVESQLVRLAQRFGTPDSSASDDFGYAIMTMLAKLVRECGEYETFLEYFYVLADYVAKNYAEHVVKVGHMGLAAFLSFREGEGEALQLLLWADEKTDDNFTIPTEDMASELFRPCVVRNRHGEFVQEWCKRLPASHIGRALIDLRVASTGGRVNKTSVEMYNAYVAKEEADTDSGRRRKLDKAFRSSWKPAV